MKVSTKGRYSLRLLLDLAEHADKGFIPLKDIAKRQEISKKYLEQIVALLNVSGMLRTNRGYQGGYKLSKPAREYTVGQILRVTEGGIWPVACLENDPNKCPRSINCKTLPVWEGLYEAICEYLDGITLQDLLDSPKGQQEKQVTIGAPETKASKPEISAPTAPYAAVNERKAPDAAISESEAPRPETGAPETRQKSDRWFWNNF